MAIRELITLEGVDQVKRSLDEINVAGEKSLGQFRQLGGQQGAGFDEVTKGAKEAGTALGDIEEGSSKAHTALTALRSVAHLLGIDMSSLGALAKIAGASLGGAFAVAAAAAAVGIGKMEEEAVRIRGQLDDLTKGRGSEAFANLSDQAKQFGTSVAGLAPGLEAFQTALNNVDRAAKGFVALKAEDLPGALRAPDINAVSKEYAIFLQLLRAGRQTQAEAEQTATSFFNALKQGGVVTKAMVESLPTGTINLLKEALGAAGQSNAQFFASIESGTVTIDKLAAALGGFGTKAQNAFDTKAIKTMGDEFGKLLAQFGVSDPVQQFSSFVQAALEEATNRIKTTKREWQGLLDLISSVEEATGLAAQRQRVLSEIMKTVFVGPQLTDTATQKGAFPADFVGPLQASGKELDNNTRITLINTEAKKDNAAKTIDLAAATRQLEAATKAQSQGSRTIQELIDAEIISVDEGIRRLNVLHDAIIDARRQQSEAIGPSKAKAVDVADALSAGKDFGVAFGKGFIQAPLSPEAVQETILTPIQEGILKGLKPPAEAQAQLVQPFEGTGNEIGTAIARGTNEAVAQTPPDFNPWLQAIIDFGAAAISKAAEIREQIQEKFSQPIQIQGQFTGFGGQAEGAPFARGGRVFGAGTATSDSIFALLSRGEFVVNARATEMFLPLLHAINAGRLPPDFIGRFNMGGLVRALSANKFAAGGQVQTSGSSHTFVLPSGQTFEATLTDQTVARLKRYSVKSRMASTGRKPGWVT
jgi:hypothetical protein